MTVDRCQLVEVPREHDWRAVASFRLSGAEVERAASGVPVTLGRDNLDHPVLILCAACEAAHHRGQGKLCPGEYVPDGSAT